jgi:hypothetical protein
VLLPWGWGSQEQDSLLTAAASPGWASLPAAMGAPLEAHNQRSPLCAQHAWASLTVFLSGPLMNTWHPVLVALFLPPSPVLPRSRSFCRAVVAGRAPGGHCITQTASDKLYTVLIVSRNVCVSGGGVIRQSMGRRGGSWWKRCLEGAHGYVRVMDG